MTNDAYVDARLAHGSLCWACPLNGQRKVGKDGPIDAEVYGIAEAPGEDEEGWGRRRGAKYGTPLVGRSGYRLRKDNLLPAGLVDVRPNERKPWPDLVNLRAFLTNVVICRPPKNDIDTPAGRHAVLCCANSLRWFMRERLRENPNITVVAIGGTAASFFRRRKTKIDAHRGRVTHAADVEAWAERVLRPVPEADILKVVLRGKKPKEEWWPAIEWFLKVTLRHSRTSLRKCTKLSVSTVNSWWLDPWTKEWKRQKAALKRSTAKA